MSPASNQRGGALLFRPARFSSDGTFFVWRDFRGPAGLSRSGWFSGDLLAFRGPAGAYFSWAVEAVMRTSEGWWAVGARVSVFDGASGLLLS